ncbi:phage virion morphogenesis protein [Marinomonas transparens]|uniref:Phage virion morphogenesis protein n=1 Tax=Marinomonas transparens TaxID=2795388 RepID=A0A934JIZ9_9GAMM|nr:phage virion morphogenesis protein [Marinomonas transparens]MBJ7536955.1 phage virion morphogenesis protein [Marinomonas transparens]
MSSHGLSAKWTGDGLLMAELKLLSLTPARRKRAMSQMGREVQRQSRRNVKQQRDVNGRSFAARKKRRTKKGRMLSGLVKRGNMRQRAKTNSVTIGFKNDVMAHLAYEHQYGTTKKVKARKMSSSQSAEWEKAPATRQQAQEMNALGFRVAAKGGKKRRVSQAWIIEHLTKKQALGILYELKGSEHKKPSWETVLPARRFFASDAQWVRAMAASVMTNEYRKGR